LWRGRSQPQLRPGSEAVLQRLWRRRRSQPRLQPRSEVALLQILLLIAATKRGRSRVRREISD